MKYKLLCVAALCSTFMSCTKEKEGVLIGRQTPVVTNRQFSAEALWAMGRIGDVQVHPKTGQVAYSVSYYSVQENKSNSELFVMNRDGSQARQITESSVKEHSPQWLNSGQLAWLEGGKLRVSRKPVVFKTLDEQGTVPVLDKVRSRAIEGVDKEIEGFAFSPDNKKVLFVAQVKTVPTTAEKYADLPLASGRIVDDLMYKHWDEWTETAPHPFVADYDGERLTNIVDILEGEPYESPMKPFGGMEQLAWSPDGRYVAYTCRKKTGLAYAISTNSDIYLYDTWDGTTRNVTEGMMGYDTNPQFSPDGTKLAWLSMERDGYESDQNRLFVIDLITCEKRFISYKFDSNVDDYLWLDDARFAFAGCWHATEHIYVVDLDGRLQEITDGQYDYGLCGYVDGEGASTLILKRHSMREADEIYALDLDAALLATAKPCTETYCAASHLEEKGILRQISFENRHIYELVDMPTVAPHWQTTTDGERMLTWIVYPPHFDPKQKYPTLLYCEGGPQSPVSQFWSYRWNFMMMGSQGYIVVAPNRRGLPGFGKAWNEQISGDYGGQCMKDYLTAIDEFSTHDFVDKDHLGCVGASFGGFSVYWLAGHHDKRFKAFIAHDGIFNMEMQYLETEEKWFANWDMGGAYWEKDNATAQRTFANSPHLFVDKWDAPILCIHGEKDYRILANQGMAAFDAAKMRGVEAELLIFPDENHWVLQPQNGVLWQRTFFAWLDKWLKK